MTDRIKQLRDQRNRLAEQMKALVPISEKTGDVDIRSDMPVSDDDLKKFLALGTHVQALDALLAVEENRLALAAARDAAVDGVAAQRGVGKDEARSVVAKKRRAFASLAFDDLAAQHGLDRRFANDEHRQIMAVDTGSGAKGGYTVPDEIIGELLVEVGHRNVIRPMSTVRQAATGVTFSVPIFDLVAYEGEANSAPRSIPERVTVDVSNPPNPDVFERNQIEFQFSEVPVVPISVGFLQDTTISNFEQTLLDGMVTMLGSWELGLMTAHAAPAGDTKVRGYLVDATKAAQAGTADTLHVDDLLKLYSNVLPHHRMNGTWVIGRTAIADILPLTIGQNLPIWSPGFPGASGTGGQRILGHPFVEDAKLGNKESAPDTPMISFGDMRAYHVFDVAGALKLKTYADSPFARNNLIGVQVFNRFGARLVTAQADYHAPVQYLTSR